MESIAKPACDFNDDVFCNVADIDFMFAQGNLVTGITVRSGNKFDLNSDNNIDDTDITEWLRIAGAINGYAGGDPNGFNAPFLRGDTDGLRNKSPTTRSVDLTDFQNLLAGFTGGGSTWEVCNFNGDNRVDITDFTIHFLTGFTQPNGQNCGAAQPVSEPNTALLGALASVGLMMWKQRFS